MIVTVGEGAIVTATSAVAAQPAGVPACRTDTVYVVLAAGEWVGFRIAEVKPAGLEVQL